LRTETADLAGDLGWEVVGALTPVVGGVVLWIIAFEGSGFIFAPPRYFPLLGGALLMTVGPPIGVAIAGSATGGTGGAGYAFLGALTGAPLSVFGIMIGSIVAYRLSADDEPDQAVSHWALTPVIAKHELSLQWSGRL
jgi:hypothetical protein